MKIEVFEEMKPQGNRGNILEEQMRIVPGLHENIVYENNYNDLQSSHGG